MIQVTRVHGVEALAQLLNSYESDERYGNWPEDLAGNVQVLVDTTPPKYDGVTGIELPSYTVIVKQVKE